MRLLSNILRSFTSNPGPLPSRFPRRANQRTETGRLTPIEFLSAAEKYVLNKVFLDEPIVKKKDMDVLTKVIAELDVKSLNLVQCHKLIGLLGGSLMRRIDFLSTSKQLNHLGNRVEVLCDFSFQNMNKQKLKNLVDVIISLTNVRLLFPKLMRLLLDNLKKNDIRDLFLQPDMNFLIPNIIWAYGRFPNTFKSDDENTFKWLLLNYNNSGSFEDNTANIVKEINFIWALFCTKFDRFLTKSHLLQIINKFAANISNVKTITYNTKLVSLIIDVFLKLFPETAKPMLSQSYIDQPCSESNPYKESYQQLLPVINSAIVSAKFNIRTEMKFHPTIITSPSGTVILQKNVLFENLELHETKIADLLIKRGITNVKPNHILGVYEVDLLIDDVIAVDIQGSHHFYSERVYRLNERELRLPPLFQKKDDILPQEQVRFENMHVLGIEHVILVRAVNMVSNTDMFFHCAVDEIMKKLTEYKEKKQKAQEAGQTLEFTIDDRNMAQRLGFNQSIVN